MAAVGAAGERAEHAVMSGIVAGDAATTAPFTQPFASAGEVEATASAARVKNASRVFMARVLLKVSHRQRPARGSVPARLITNGCAFAIVRARHFSQPGARSTVMAKGPM